MTFRLFLLIIIAINIGSAQSNFPPNIKINNEKEFEAVYSFIKTKYYGRSQDSSYLTNKYLIIECFEWLKVHSYNNRLSCLYYLSKICGVNSDYILELEINKFKLKLIENTKSKDLPGIYYKLALSTSYLENYPQSLYYLTKYLEVYKEINPKLSGDRFGHTYRELGFVYYHMGIFEEALKCYKICFQEISIKNYFYEPSVAHDIGQCFRELRMKDSALAYFDLSIHIMEKYNRLPNANKRYIEYFKPIVEASKFDYAIEDKKYKLAFLLGIGEVKGGLLYDDYGAISRGYYKAMVAQYNLCNYNGSLKYYDLYEKIRVKKPDIHLQILAQKTHLNINIALKKYNEALLDLHKIDILEKRIAQKSIKEKQGMILKANLKVKEEEVKTIQREMVLMKKNSIYKNIIILLIVILSLGSLFFYIREKKTSVLIKNQNNMISQENVKQKTLIREIHHRVKNNLQLISSYLQLQINKTSNSESKIILGDTIKNIESIALVHQNLYKKEDFFEVNLRGYLNDICQNIKSFSHKNHVEYILDIEDIEVPIDTAINLGLVINELITNSIKYAFVNEGEINIRINKLNSETLQIQYFDNGQGTNIETIQKNKSIGLTMVEEIIQRELGGDLNYQLENGFGINFNFKV